MDTFQTFLNACCNGQKSIAKLLLERGGIDLNRRDAEGNTKDEILQRAEKVCSQV